MKAADGQTNEERGTCFKGHPWTPENIFTSTDGKIRCKLCRRDRSKSYNKYETEADAHAARVEALHRKLLARTHFGCGCPITPENSFIRKNTSKNLAPSKACKTCYEQQSLSRRKNYILGSVESSDCTYCGTPLPEGRRKYCCKRCYVADDVSGFKGRARQFNVAYEICRKRDVFMNDRYVCQHCKKLCDPKAESPWDRPEIDHVLPMSKGGGHIRTNLQTLCGRCNRGKSGKGIQIVREPKLDFVLDWAPFVGIGRFVDPDLLIDDRWCERCVNFYTPKTINQKYCSEKCSRRAADARKRIREKKPLVDKVCPSCEAPFQTYRPTQVTCGNKHCYYLYTIAPSPKTELGSILSVPQGGSNNSTSIS